MKKQGSGWHGESRRHSMARKGIKTAHGKISTDSPTLAVMLSRLDQAENPQIEFVISEMLIEEKFDEKMIWEIIDNLDETTYNGNLRKMVERELNIHKVKMESDLRGIRYNLGDVVRYDGREFTQSYYSKSSFESDNLKSSNKERSKEIIWHDIDGNQIYLFKDTIEYIPADQTKKHFIVEGDE